MSASYLDSRSPAMAELAKKLERLAEMDARLGEMDGKARTPCNVLILGETGVGKDVTARRIHERSGRGDRPFVAVNCSAMPEGLFESELFGHERGAFTGAVAKKKGLLEEAGGGTLFLDEIGDMPLALQAKLLRVLQNRTVRRVGGNKGQEIDVRLIVATNRDLPELVAAGEFRRDLFCRLNVFAVTVPPLRERRGDIPALADHFCEVFAAKYGVRRKSVSEGAAEMFLAYAWPGNVRELEHVVEFAYIVGRSESIEPADIGEKLAPDAMSETPVSGPMTIAKARADLYRWTLTLPESVGFHEIKAILEEAKIQYCKNVFEAHGGNLSASAKSMGIDRTYLRKILREPSLA